MGRYTCVLVVALACAGRVVMAQPSLPSPMSDPTAQARTPTTTIPVSVDGKTEVLEAETAASSAGPAPVALEQPVDPATYICGPGDAFELNFWGQQNFRLKIGADLEGKLFITKVGYVEVAGKTLQAVRELVKQRVRSTYPGLRSDLTLVAARSFLVHIVDNVKLPGLYTATPLERVSAVLARAGGLNGSRRRIRIRHRNGTTANVDLVQYEIGGDTTANPFLLDGDVIEVPFKQLEVTIAGAVHRPGSYELVKTKDITELFELAGGVTSAAAAALPVQLVRRNEKRQLVVESMRTTAGVPANRTLQDGDRVIVRSDADLQRTVFLMGAVEGAEQVDAATTARPLSFIEGDTVDSLLSRAGGVRPAGDLRRSYISRPRAGKAAELIALDLEALLVKRDFAADRAIQMGDTIVVPPARRSILVEGAVSRPGLYTFNPLFEVPQYIALAGGRSRTARDMDEVQVIDISGATRRFEAGKRPQPGDAILVPERTFSRPEIVQIVLATAGIVLSGVAITLAATR